MGHDASERTGNDGLREYNRPDLGGELPSSGRTFRSAPTNTRRPGRMYG